MERIINQRYVELIAEAINAVPPKIMEAIRPIHFFTGTDPYYAGLELADDDVEGGRNWKTTMHYLPVACQQHLPQYLRCPTIVIPFLDELPADIVHELGHALDANTMWYQYETDIIPVTEYAKTDQCEAFAEAFASCLYWDYGNFREPDQETYALLIRLARGY